MNGSNNKVAFSYEFLQFDLYENVKYFEKSKHECLPLTPAHFMRLLKVL